jgi:membrane protease YdiL (CAAX protease family)
VAVIAFNVVVQAVTYGLERSARVQPSTAISIGLWVGLAFYGVVAVFALRTRAAAFVRTVWTVGDPGIALRNGLLVGGGTSLVVLGLQSLASHHLVGDPNVQLVVSDGSIWRILAAFVLFVAAAPLVEEYIFRGVLAESLRGRGTRLAILSSAVLFALAHLRPAGLIYYSLIGCILGRLYFRYGLKASVAAHAVFNGLLVVAAIISVVGPAKTYVDDGAVLHLPAAWRTANLPAGFPYQFAARGPSGAAILVLDRPVPGGYTFDPAALEAAAQSHHLPLPAGASVTSATSVTYPAGTAAVLKFTESGQGGQVAVMVENSKEWVFVLSTAGSSKAVTDFDHMMHQLTLP